MDWIAATVTAVAALVTAVSLAMQRRHKSRLTVLELALDELRTQVREARADAADARGIARQVSEARASDEATHQSELRARDSLIAQHMRWDRQAIAQMVACNPAHDLGDPPPLFPGLMPE